MDSATEDLYLQKIEEFVYDEDKIVTFSWLSTTLNISTSESKRLLEKYTTDHRSQKSEELSIIFVLSGIDENNTSSVTLVKEGELEEKSDSLKEVLKKQVYSVQKCKQVDVNAVGLVDYFDIHKPPEVPIIGAIRSKNCIKRIFKKKKALPPPPPPTYKGKSSFFTKVQPKSSEKLETKPKDVNSLNNKEKPSTNGMKQNNVKGGKGKQNGFANFFTKGAPTPPKADAKPKVEEASKSEDAKKAPPAESNGVEKNKTPNLIDSDSESEDIIAPTPTLEKQKPRRSVKRQKKENKKSAPSPKRRKRIIQNDSDSDDIFGNEENDEPEERFNERSDEDSEPVFKPEPPPPQKNKKRKLVDRTFTDEDGYIITRKEWVEESGSEDEKEDAKKNESIKENLKASEEKVKVNNEHKRLKKKSEDDTTNDKPVNGKAKGNAKGKKQIASNQQTLMSFFKKK